MEKWTVIGLLFLSCAGRQDRALEWNTDMLRFSLDAKGSVKTMADRRTGVNYLHGDSQAPFLSIRKAGVMLFPVSAGLEKNGTHLVLGYEDGTEARVRVRAKRSHLVFELISVSGAREKELIVWGPYPTTAGEVVGETVGVVQEGDFTLGIQSLNPKTLGGYPWQENDCMPQIDLFEQEDYSDLSEAGKRGVLYRVEAAKPADFGSTLQAYCRNRSAARVIENWGHERYSAPPFGDGGIAGSKIALFGCPTGQALKTLGRIEKAEHLPHPMVDGVWGKTALTASAAYLILDYGEADIEKAVALTKKAGLRYLYHSGPFKTWGHFGLNDQFPHGWRGLRTCVRKAQKEGVMLGVHMLSNFVTTNDPYVTPVPDPRLARVGTGRLAAGIDERVTEIEIESPEYFNPSANDALRTARIGKELVRYAAVTEKAPWTLLGCTRGAFGTSPSAHAKGEEIHKLADHAYQVFLTDARLSIEMAERMADLFNATGVRQISFDGLEGNRSTGMGNYGEILFTTAWYNRLKGGIRRHFIADASRTSHFFWHIYTRMNWGEPWYAGFRESQTEYRLKNQAYFKRNLMPAMLGWFSMTGQTTVEDVEWMLARSAGFDAGYGFVTSFRTLEENARSDEILRLLGLWEKARMAGAFSGEQKKRMQDVTNEFHLEAAGTGSWVLRPVLSHKESCGIRRRHGRARCAFEFENPCQEQPLEMILRSEGGTAGGIQIILDGKGVTLPFALGDGEYARLAGDKEWERHSPNGQMASVHNQDSAFPRLSPGKHGMTLECVLEGSGESRLKLEIRITGDAETVKARG